jgi:2-octaprenyl-6-methoxyphenol hydroxylase
MKQQYDIVIIGAGMVGASFAAALIEQAAELNLSIALIEAKALADTDNTLSYQPSFDSRATALSFGSSLIYQQLGVWQQLQQHAQAIEHIHVSDKGHFGATRLHAKQEKVPALGYVIENKWLGDVLHQHIKQHPNKQCVELVCPASIESIERVAGNMQLQVNHEGNQFSLSASLVVIADGGRSSLREQLGIDYTEKHYQQHALVANVAIDRTHNNVAYERFTDTGPIAILPLAKQARTHRCGLIWTVPDEDVQRISDLSDDQFLIELQQRFGFRVGRFKSVGQRFNYPLTLQAAPEQVRAGLVVVGNAAHTLHPIAGQGFNLALRGVLSLAKCVLQAAKNGQPLGDFKMLSAYQHERSADQQATIGFSDKSMKLFSTNQPLLALGRDIGLQCLDICPPAKTMFARSAMGLSNPMSNLD